MIFVLALVVAVAAAVRGVWSPCGLSMLSSLNPVSEATRGHRFWVTALWYLAGAVAGGALLGGGLAVAAFSVGRLQPSAAVAAGCALGCAAVAVASDARVFGFSLPVHPRQVDERWLTAYRRWIYAGGFGVQIGAGFATYIMSAAVYLTAALAVLTASPAQAFAVALTFGGVRGLAIGVCAFATTPDALRALLGGIERRAAMSVRVVSCVCAGVAGVAATRLGGPVAGSATMLVLVAVPLLGRHHRARLTLGTRVDRLRIGLRIGFRLGRAATGQQAGARD